MSRAIRHGIAAAALACALVPAAGAQTLHHVRRRMTLELAGSADSLFVLFGPRREGEWARGWTPRFIYPADGRQVAEGAVFTTPAGHHDRGLAYWVMNEYDVVARRVRYVCVVPEATAMQLEITVTPTARSMARVEVTYTYTALAETANASVDAFAAGFASLRAHWQRALGDYLARRAARPRPHARRELPPASTTENHMEIKRAGSQPSARGTTDWFTGTVRIDPLFGAPAPARAAGAAAVRLFRAQWCANREHHRIQGAVEA